MSSPTPPRTPAFVEHRGGGHWLPDGTHVRHEHERRVHYDDGSKSPWHAWEDRDLYNNPDDNGAP